MKRRKSVFNERSIIKSLLSLLSLWVTQRIHLHSWRIPVFVSTDFYLFLSCWFRFHRSFLSSGTCGLVVWSSSTTEYCKNDHFRDMLELTWIGFIFVLKSNIFIETFYKWHFMNINFLEEKLIRTFNSLKSNSASSF